MIEHLVIRAIRASILIVMRICSHYLLDILLFEGDLLFTLRHVILFGQHILIKHTLGNFILHL